MIRSAAMGSGSPSADAILNNRTNFNLSIASDPMRTNGPMACLLNAAPRRTDDVTPPGSTSADYTVRLKQVGQLAYRKDLTIAYAALFVRSWSRELRPPRSYR
jgi:hypothetical protein